VFSYTPTPSCLSAAFHRFSRYTSSAYIGSVMYGQQLRPVGGRLRFVAGGRLCTHIRRRPRPLPSSHNQQRRRRLSDRDGWSRRAAPWRRCQRAKPRSRSQHLLSEWGSGMNGLLVLSNTGELHSYIDTPETPRMFCIRSERAESVRNRLYPVGIDRTRLE
jgi:hypothetical protein